jgi:hypothetical protein
LDFVKMVDQLLQDFVAVFPFRRAPEILQRKMNDVVVMQLFFGNLFAELEPRLVQEIDFLGSQPRSVRPR